MRTSPKPTPGSAIIRLRAQRGLSTVELTFEANRHLPRPLRIVDETLRKWEHDEVPRRGIPTTQLMAIARALNISVTELSPSAGVDAAQISDLARWHEATGAA